MLGVQVHTVRHGLWCRGRTFWLKHKIRVAFFTHVSRIAAINMNPMQQMMQLMQQACQGNQMQPAQSNQMGQPCEMNQAGNASGMPIQSGQPQLANQMGQTGNGMLNQVADPSQMMAQMMAHMMQSAGGPPPKKYKKDDSALLNSGATLLHELPVYRLQRAIEFQQPAMDAIATDGFSKEHLSRVIWALTNVKPNLNVSNLRTESYGHLNAKIQTHMQRHIQSVSQRRFDEILMALTPLTPERVTHVTCSCLDFFRVLEEDRGEWVVWVGLSLSHVT